MEQAPQRTPRQIRDGNKDRPRPSADKRKVILNKEEKRFLASYQRDEARIKWP